jgi:hypothetical protein
MPAAQSDGTSTRLAVELVEGSPVRDQFSLARDAEEEAAIQRDYFAAALKHGVVLTQIPRGDVEVDHKVIPVRTQPPGAVNIYRRQTDMLINDWSVFDAAFMDILSGKAQPPHRLGARHRWVLPVQENWPVPVSEALRRLPSIDTSDLQPDDLFLSSFPYNLQQVAGLYVEHTQQGLGNTHVPVVHLSTDWLARDLRRMSDGAWQRGTMPVDELRALMAIAGGIRDAAEQAGGEVQVRLEVEHEIYDKKPLRDWTQVLLDGERFFQKRLRYLTWDRLADTYWLERRLPHAAMPPAATTGWLVRSWADGADGVMIRPGTGTGRGWNRAQANALLLPGIRQGVKGPLPTLRLKALRRAVQDLSMLQALPSADRGAVRRTLRRQFESAADMERAENAVFWQRLRKGLRGRLQ